MSGFDAADIRRYYDRHTPAFVALGQGGRLGAIHRAVWGEGVRDRRSAFRYVEDQITELIQALPRSADLPHVVDLGCGIGSSLLHLMARIPMRGTGVTLSPVQARLATQRVRDAGLSDRIACFEGDFCELPPALEPADVAYAIESFVHVLTPARFFEQCARLVRPGGLLVICDDVKGLEGGPGAARTIEEFSRGWHVNALLEPGELRALGRAAGFEHESTKDLSPYLELHRMRDRLIRVWLALWERLPVDRHRLDHLRGGQALQTCLENGWVRYELTVFRRV